MTVGEQAAVAAPPVGGETLSFQATDVTGTHCATVGDVQRALPAGAVAQSLASMWSLPENVPWSLRDDSTGAFLDDAAPIGEQLGREAEARLTVTPRTHLG